MTPLRRLLPLCLALAAAQPAAAVPRAYALDPAASRVGFAVGFGPDLIEGRMDVASAELSLDLDRVSGSQLRVAVDVTQARTNIPFATEAMLGPRVLDAGRHPTITFVSRRVTLIGDGHAVVEGDLTLRGVTRPATLDARLTRDAGRASGDYSQLTIALTGQVSRAAFGASGWADQVADTVRLDILAAIRAVE